MKFHQNLCELSKLFRLSRTALKIIYLFFPLSLALSLPSVVTAIGSEYFRSRLVRVSKFKLHAVDKDYITKVSYERLFNFSLTSDVKNFVQI